VSDVEVVATPFDELLACFSGSNPEDIRVITTSFGMRFICYKSPDGGFHSVVSDADVSNFMIKWDYGPANMLSFVRLSEMASLMSEAKKQLTGLSNSPSFRFVERRASDSYVPDAALEKRLASFSWKIDDFELSAEQKDAVKLILSKISQVTVLTGQAGSGKSAVIRWLMANCLATVCATTGRAAINVGGITVDSLFCFSRDGWQVFNSHVLERNMKAAHKIIVIDEASMVGNKMGELLITLAERYEKHLVLVGDWAQASPVKEGWAHESRLFDDSRFIRLEECHRQSDGVFLDVLNKVRVGEVDLQVQDVLSSRAMKAPEETGWIRMYATNKMAEDFNRLMLQKHCSITKDIQFSVKAKFIDERPKSSRTEPRTQSFIAKVLDDSPYAHNTVFALGAQVLITANEQGETRTYVNGDVGTISNVYLSVDVKAAEEADTFGDPIIWKPSATLASLDDTEAFRHSMLMTSETKDGRPIVTVDGINVCLDRTGTVVNVRAHSSMYKNGVGDAVHSVVGLPIRLGYAITIHKAQGMTVDKAWLDMGSIKNMPEGSRHGLAYVGLSRVRTLEGLGIGSWDPSVIECSPDVAQLV
jgi:ATP-dependent DNA helicase PIF1